MDVTDKIDIDSLLPKMDAFMRTMHHVSMDLEINPKKEHIGTCINYNDLIQLKTDFVKELLASVSRFVYAQAKGKEIVTKLEADHETEDAYNLLNQQAKDKFRPYSVQGQFSELLLFNLLQYHFKAVPLIRKMKITTNVQLERNGADAIHIARDGDKYRLYLGEAKTYTSGFKAGFKESLKSIVDTFSKHKSELDLYKFEDFLEPELLNIATKYINNELDNVEVHLVCIITYCVGDVALGATRQETIDQYVSSIINEVKKIKDTDYPEIETPILARINYIFMPVNGLEQLIGDFKKKLGV